MKRSFGVPVGSDGDDVAAVLGYARQLDPDCSEDAIRRYVHEIAEMADLLDQIDLAGHETIAPFSPNWAAADLT